MRKPRRWTFTYKNRKMKSVDRIYDGGGGGDRAEVINKIEHHLSIMPPGHCPDGEGVLTILPDGNTLIEISD
jgi:hypothetical protein